MSSKISSQICVNVEKVCKEWIVEIFFSKSGTDPQWISRDRNKLKAIHKAQDKLNRAVNKLYDMELAGK